MEVPMGEPLEDLLEDPMDEETEEGPMFEEPIEIEESEEDLMEEHGQGGQEGAGDPDDGDDSDDSDSDGGDDGGDGGDGNGGDGGDDGGDDGNGGDDDHDALLAQGWTTEIHYDLEGDAYYHPRLLALVHRYHPGGTVHYRTEHWTHPDYTGFRETEVYIREGTQVRYIHHTTIAWLTCVAIIRDAAR